mgnify:CR=1 FL=1
MPKKRSFSKAKRNASARRTALSPPAKPLQGRELAMPKYDYQSPRSGSFVIRYQDDEERKKTTATLPALQNFHFSP